jgi:hypothetical protein
MALISPAHSPWLMAESRQQPLHVAGLATFELRSGAGPDKDLVELDV